jgi:hypothetical protein
MKKTIALIFSIFFLLSSCTKEASDASSESVLSGSYSTMLTLGNKLYIVSKTTIFTYDATDAKNLILLDEQSLGFDIESLIHHEGLLLIGSKSSMHIYTLDDKGIPVKQSQTQYFGVAEGLCNSDPIVTRNNIAYVTLSSSVEACGNTRLINELRIYNISDINNPVLINSYTMENPKGLGLGKNSLFVCDAKLGLIVFDVTNPGSIIETQDFSDIEPYDVIVKGTILIVVAKDQLLQYDISDENNVKLLSSIAI